MDNEKKIKTEDVVEMTVEELEAEGYTFEEKKKQGEGGHLTPIDPLIREQAYRMYMDHVSPASICAELGLKKTTLASWTSRGGWTKLRQEADDLVLADIIQSKKVQFSVLASLILEGATKAIKRDAGRDGFKAKDVPTYLNALTSVEKLARLSLGQATSISEERGKRVNVTLPISNQDMSRLTNVKMTVDPFQQLEAPNTPEVLNHDNTRAGGESDSNDPS
jgi:hypothetical protein